MYTIIHRDIKKDLKGSSGAQGLLVYKVGKNRLNDYILLSWNVPLVGKNQMQLSATPFLPGMNEIESLMKKTLLGTETTREVNFREFKMKVQ